MSTLHCLVLLLGQEFLSPFLANREAMCAVECPPVGVSLMFFSRLDGLRIFGKNVTSYQQINDMW